MAQTKRTEKPTAALAVQDPAPDPLRNAVPAFADPVPTDADTVVIEAETIVVKAPAPAAMTDMSLYVVTDHASVGPVRVADKLTRIYKGRLYPFEQTAEMGRLISNGDLRMATSEDVEKAKTLESGPGGSLTAASMAGIGIIRN